jgi:hypothetical protein
LWPRRTGLILQRVDLRLQPLDQLHERTEIDHVLDPNLVLATRLPRPCRPNHAVLDVDAERAEVRVVLRAWDCGRVRSSTQDDKTERSQ